MPNPFQTFGGAAQLAFDCAGGILRAVEQMHATIARRPIPWAQPPGGSHGASGKVAGQIYALLQGTHGALADAVSHGVRAMAMLPSLSPEDAPGSVGSAAILNGICGDHLEATRNPLAISMSLRTLDGPIAWTPQGVAASNPRLSPHIAVWVHGLCLSEQNWVRSGGDAMGERLRDDLDIAPVYVRYNSGRHISTNGRELSDRLEQMIESWPVPVQSLALIGHSMGGLIIRSAGWYGDRGARVWRRKLRNVVCLAAPHHGAALEKGGELFTRAMQMNPYLNPLAFGRERSAGIKDLRYGNLIDEDWQLGDADQSRPDTRNQVPLLPGVNHYFAAATVGHRENGLLGHILGDLLVGTGSAFGVHADARKRLEIPPQNCRIFRNMNHFDLLGHPEVYEQLVAWLKRDRFGS